MHGSRTQYPLHIIQRGNNHQACFYAEQDYQFFLEWLGKYVKETGCAIHAYVLMTNHVHLLLTPNQAGSAGQVMKRLGQGVDSEVVTPNERYNSLNCSEESRLTAYRELFRYELDTGVIDEIRSATNANYALGSDRFIKQVSEMLGRCVTRGRAGRPRVGE